MWTTTTDVQRNIMYIFENINKIGFGTSYCHVNNKLCWRKLKSELGEFPQGRLTKQRMQTFLSFESQKVSRSSLKQWMYSSRQCVDSLFWKQVCEQIRIRNQDHSNPAQRFNSYLSLSPCHNAYSPKEWRMGFKGLFLW